MAIDGEALAGHKAQLMRLHEQLERHRQAIDDALDTLDTLIVAPEGRTSLAGIKEIRARYASSSARALELVNLDRLGDAIGLMNGETLPALNALQGLIKRLLESQQKGIPVGQLEVKQQLDSALTLMKVLDGAPAAVWQSSPADDS